MDGYETGFVLERAQKLVDKKNPTQVSKNLNFFIDFLLDKEANNGGNLFVTTLVSRELLSDVLRTVSYLRDNMKSSSIDRLVSKLEKIHEESPSHMLDVIYFNIIEAQS